MANGTIETAASIYRGNVSFTFALDWWLTGKQLRIKAKGKSGGAFSAPIYLMGPNENNPGYIKITENGTETTIQSFPNTTDTPHYFALGGQKNTYVNCRTAAGDDEWSINLTGTGTETVTVTFRIFFWNSTSYQWSITETSVELTLELSITVTGLSLNKSITKIRKGSSETLIANIAPSDATDKSTSWDTSAPAIATVSSGGVVTALATGTATITATTNDGSFSASCIVEIIGAAMLFDGGGWTGFIAELFDGTAWSEYVQQIYNGTAWEDY